MDQGMKKSSHVLRQIACELLSKEAGDRMEPISELSQRLHASAGTVQNAIRTLEREGVIGILVRGHLGSFLSYLDYDRLLTYAGISSVFCAMPIPYSVRYKGLASGIRQQLSTLGLEKTGMFFISGSQCRINALLEERVDGVVLSGLSARHYLESGLPVEILHKFPAGSYINNHYLITRKGFDLEHCASVRVGVDNSSHDQQMWNRICFAGLNVQEVPVHYLHVLEHIKSGYIDATVWSFEDSYPDPALSAVELHAPGMEENTAAVLLARRDDVGMRGFLKRNIDFDQISRTQRAVMDGSILPDY